MNILFIYICVGFMVTETPIVSVFGYFPLQGHMCTISDSRYSKKKILSIGFHKVGLMLYM